MIVNIHLVQVNISLAAANARLRNTREERDQFEEANTKIVAHLETKVLMDIMSPSIVDVLNNPWLIYPVFFFWGG